MDGRVDLYEWIRLIATILVVIGHSAYIEMSTNYGSINYGIPSDVSSVYGSVMSVVNPLLSWICGFHMPLFFMLSGAVLAIKPLKTFDEVVKSKVRRLMVPYYLAGFLFMIPLKYIGNYYSQETVSSVMKVFWNSGAESGHLWFLPALFWCMIFFVILQKIMVRMNIQSACLVLLLSEIIALCRERLSFDFLLLKEGLGYLLWFALGYYFESIRKKGFIEDISLFKLIISAAGFFLVAVLDYKFGFVDDFFRVIFGAIFMLILAEILSRVFDIKRINIITRNLFYIYLFHDPLEYVILRIAFGKAQLLTTGFGCFLYVFMRTVGVFVISMALGEILGRIKKELKRIDIQARNNVVLEKKEIKQ